MLEKHVIRAMKWLIVDFYGASVLLPTQELEDICIDSKFNPGTVEGVLLPESGYSSSGRRYRRASKRARCVMQVRILNVYIRQKLSLLSG